jgi:ABC-type multidrug transport system, ATPase and permease components
MEDQAKMKMTFWGAVKFINGFLDKLHFKLVLFYFGWLFDTVAEVVTPVLFGVMVNQIVYYRNLSLFIVIGIVFFALSVFTSVLYFLLYEMYGIFWNELIYRMRCRMFSVVLKMDAKAMLDSNYGDIAQLIQWKVMECVHFIVRNIVHNINNYFRIVACLMISFLIDPWIVLIMVFMVPVSVFVSWKFGKKIRRERDRNQAVYGRYLSWLYEVFHALKDIRLLGAENRVRKIFYKHQETMIETDINASVETLKAENIIANVNTWIQMVLYAVLAVIAVYQGVSIGSVIVILTYFDSLTDALENVSSRYMDAQERISVIERIKDFMERPVVEESHRNAELFVKDGEIEFQDISFAYPGKESVLHRFSLKIKKGEKIALAGESGCGKTTLSYLLLGFYHVDSGRILIDHMDTAACTLESIRSNIGVVQQDVLIFDGTIRYNIMLGNEKATEEEFIKACKAAGVYDFVMEMENKFDTLLGREGRQLSGGQKQRIAIARIYLKDPSIIVFDEATASLDTETEEQIHGAWKEVLKDRTSIIIAHRQSSVMLCDRVVILRGGQVVETGTPRDLEQTSEEFRTLFAIS